VISGVTWLLWAGQTTFFVGLRSLPEIPCAIRGWRLSPGVKRSTGWLAAVAVSGILAGMNRPAAAADAQVVLSCQQLTREESGKLETRIRVRLLATTSSTARVSVACSEQLGTIVVESDAARASREVALAGVDAADTLVAAVESALEELAAQQADSTAPAPVAAAPSAGHGQPLPPPAPTPEPVAAQPSAVASAPAQPAATLAPGPEQFAELWLGVLGEAWRDRLALGGAVGAAYGSRALSFGLRVGGLTAVPRYAAFSATELSADAAVAWQPPWSLGVRGRLSVGPSLLVVTPRASFRPRAGTTVAAWCVGLMLTRPFRFGHFAVVPEVGARLFSSQRNVNLDDREQLALGPVGPHLGLGISY